MADAIPHLRLTVIDAMLMADQAADQGIRSVPTVMLDERIRWTGSIDMDEIIQQCTQRDPVLLSTASLRQIIESGDAARVAGMMADHGRIFPAIIELLTDERWSIRLGAMVTAEYLARPCGISSGR